MTYSISVSKSFRAEHWMPSGKPEELVPHQHDYRIHVTLEGENLGDDGFLMDIDLLKGGLDDLVSRLSGTKVNNLPELRGGPPSMENFAAALWTAILTKLDTSGVESMTVTLWESEDAAASYGKRLRG
ncbi:MAG: 6-carboxytetrahydropterin synthase [Methanomassiliicoccales archaeon]|jgi:6-pyruvoyltetrahydropterin/6-carboxytetrahydropterin synthase